MKSMPYLESCVLQHFGSTQAFINYAFSIWLQDYCVTVSPNFTVTSCSDFTWISTAFLSVICIIGRLNTALMLCHVPDSDLSSAWRGDADAVLLRVLLKIGVAGRELKFYPF